MPRLVRINEPAWLTVEDCGRETGLCDLVGAWTPAQRWAGCVLERPRGRGRSLERRNCPDVLDISPRA